MKPLIIAGTLGLAFTGLAATAVAAGGGHLNERLKLDGYHEVPAISTQATGTFRLRENQDGSLAYTLSYSGLEAPVTQAHIHFGQSFVSAGIMVWLCGTSTNPGPAGTPVCPPEGEVSGTITAAQVVGPAAQGIAPGEFAEAVRAMRAGVAYANVHSTKFPSGEIRAQFDKPDRDD